MLEENGLIQCTIGGFDFGAIHLRSFAKVEWERQKGQRFVFLTVHRCRFLIMAYGPLGSLFDKNLRIPMENPIFRKLQEAMERPCRSKEWFPLAEQAINTIYALGERPDLLCDSIIKNYTRRAFAKKTKPTPRTDESMDVEGEGGAEEREASQEQGEEVGEDGKDVGDAFELAQLLFVVGHVAIKHIVFLELVERELKGQKHEREKGIFFVTPSLSTPLNTYTTF